MKPIEKLINGSARCVKCGAKYGMCDCWTKCKCGWLYEKGGKCRNPIHDKKTNDMNISKALKRIRLEKGMTIIEAAKKAKTTKERLSSFESGKGIPDNQDLKKLQKAYDVPPAVFAWYAMDRKDVRLGKMEDFKRLKRIIDHFIKQYLKK